MTQVQRRIPGQKCFTKFGLPPHTTKDFTEILGKRSYKKFQVMEVTLKSQQANRKLASRCPESFQWWWVLCTCKPNLVKHFCLWTCVLCLCLGKPFNKQTFLYQKPWRRQLRQPQTMVVHALPSGCQHSYYMRLVARGLSDTRLDG